jgi:hypothetical protein
MGDEGNKIHANGSGSRGIFETLAEGFGGAGSGSNAPKKMSTTARLAEEHGIKTSIIMYVSNLVRKQLQTDYIPNKSP